jgi:Protamine P1.
VFFCTGWFISPSAAAEAAAAATAGWRSAQAAGGLSWRREPKPGGRGGTRSQRGECAAEAAEEAGSGARRDGDRRRRRGAGEGDRTGEGEGEGGPVPPRCCSRYGLFRTPSLVSAYALGLSGPKTPLLPGVVLRIRTSFFKD